MSRDSIALRSVLFALFGFGVQLAIVLAIGFGVRWKDFLAPVLISLIGLLIGAYVLGLFFGNFLTATNTTRLKAILVGSLTGWISLLAQTLSGSSVSFFVESHLTSNGFGDYIIKPTFWVMFLGSIPALIIGAFFGNSAWKAVHKRLP
jgi:hypothetical protein